MKRSYVLSALFILVVAVITVVIVVSNNDVESILAAITSMDPLWLGLGALAALLFVALEGCIIVLLLRSIGEKARVRQGIRWSYVGFFFSAITPSATGGQPAQLFYMHRDGFGITKSTPVLMITAVLYKIVAVVIGVALPVFWNEGLVEHFGSYLWIYYVGLFLNTALVVILVFVMVTPTLAKKVVLAIERGLVRIRILKHSVERIPKLVDAVEEYGSVIKNFRKQKFRLFVALGITFVQRICLFVLTWFVYCGMGLSAESALVVSSLQAAVYIAVDMLPLPGSAGVTELVYAAAFSSIFIGGTLGASLLISRGLSFYLPLLVSALVFVYSQIRYGKRNNAELQ
ncbi:MAG: lysylphosphatidylglycerol synthase transmembrane domain-containing protein [Raoultibacter sp.]|jgi:uncharacterized protein (TIRG00374 family)